MKRITAAITALALPVAFLLLAVPAKATLVENVTVWFASGTPTTGQIIQGGSYMVTADAHADLSFLKSFSVALQGDSATGDYSMTKSNTDKYQIANPTTLTHDDTISFPWDVKTMTTRNGKYTLTANAQSQLGNSATPMIVDSIAVNVPPAAPAGVNMTMQSEVPHISWAPNPETDLLNYQVQRSADAGTYITIATTAVNQTIFDDSAAPKGVNLRYRIVASRYSPVTSTILSLPSAETAAAFITPPAPGPVPGPVTAPAPASAPVTVAPAAAPKAPPITLPAAVAPQIAAAAPKTVAAPAQERPKFRKEFLGGSTFSQTLPYPAVAPAPPTSQDSMPAMVGRKAVTAITRAVSSVPKPRYLAVALMMLVLALHVSRAARQLTGQQA